MKRILLLIIVSSLLVLTTGCEKKIEQVDSDANETIDFIGNIVQSEDGVLSLKLIEGYNIYPEEPNRYILTNESSKEIYARIEILDDSTDMEDLKSTLFDSYKIEGEVSELISDNFNHPFLDNCDFVLKVDQNNASESTIEIAAISNNQVKIMISLFYSTESELETIKTDYWNMISTIESQNANE